MASKLQNKNGMKDEGNLTSVTHSKHSKHFSTFSLSLSLSLSSLLLLSVFLFCSGEKWQQRPMTIALPKQFAHTCCVLYVLMNMCFRQIVLYQMKPIRDEPIDSDELHLWNYKNDYFRNWTTSTVQCTTMYTIHSFRFLLILSAIEQCSMFNRL